MKTSAGIFNGDIGRVLTAGAGGGEFEAQAVFSELQRQARSTPRFQTQLESPQLFMIIYPAWIIVEAITINVAHSPGLWYYL